MDTLWFWLERSGLIATFVTVIPLVIGGYYFVTKGRRQKKILEQIKCSPGQHSVIFLVEIDGDIEGQVRNWCEQQPHLKGLELYKVSHNGKLQEKDLDKLVRHIKATINEMTGCGTDKIHLFFRGPVPVAAMLGAVLANGCKVILYHMDRGGEQLYVSWGPLERDVV